jgi:YrbI family 3-deoxy-D-manno-octulosonate 8-phosphate phosphatase
VIEMSAVAVIPARGGSKGIHRKNLQRVGGLPLVARAVRSALAADVFERIVVSTDDPEIAQVARQAGAEIIDRPRELAVDSASSESALTHALDQLIAGGSEPTEVAMLQATSPFVDPDDLARAVELIRSGLADSTFSAIPTHTFLWRRGDSGARGVNHDHRVRLRRQDIEPQLAETGAFYAMHAAGYRSAGHRFFGHIEPVEVDPTWAIDVDDAADLARAQRLAHEFLPGGLSTRLATVQALVTDFDGVHTPNTAMLAENGHELVQVNRSDGLGVDLLRSAGVPMLILSKERNRVVTARAGKLRVECLQAIDDKLKTLHRWADQRSIPMKQIAYIGNDTNDIECLRGVGFGAVPADSHPAAMAAANWVLGRRGGDGAVRELADLIIQVREGACM